MESNERKYWWSPSRAFPRSTTAQASYLGCSQRASPPSWREKKASTKICFPSVWFRNVLSSAQGNSLKEDWPWYNRTQSTSSFCYLAILVVVSRKFCRAPLKSRPTDKKSLWNSLVNLEDRFKVEKVQTLSLTWENPHAQAVSSLQVLHWWTCWSTM